MSFEVVEEHVNSLLGRREAKLIVHHEGAGTPDRTTVRKLASQHFKAQLDRVYVRSISTRTGGSSALCRVEVYEDAKLADKIVPAYLKNRNLPKEQRVSKRKKEEPTPTPAAVKPAGEKKGVEATKPPAKAEKKEEPLPAVSKEGKAPSRSEPKAKA